MTLIHHILPIQIANEPQFKPTEPNLNSWVKVMNQVTLIYFRWFFSSWQGSLLVPPTTDVMWFFPALLFLYDQQNKMHNITNKKKIIICEERLTSVL